MSVTAAYVLHGINIASPAAFVSQVTNARVMTGINVQKGIPSGLPGARFIYNMNQMLEASFDTTQVKSVLDACGTSPQLVSCGSGNTDYYFKQTTNLASRVDDATTSHVRLRAPKAVLIPQSISASDGQPASISVRMINTFDGTNAPLVGAAAALAGTPSHAENFTLGPASINGTLIGGIQDCTINFGISTIEKRGDGELYLSHVCEKETLPTVTIRTLGSPWATYGINGTALTSMSVWFRKCLETARTADATAEHILFTATAGLFVIEETGGGGNEPVITTITCHLAMPDATTRPLLVDTTAAIE